MKFTITTKGSYIDIQHIEAESEEAAIEEAEGLIQCVEDGVEHEFYLNPEGDSREIKEVDEWT